MSEQAQLAKTRVFWQKCRTDAVLPTRAPALTNAERTRFEMADTFPSLNDESIKARFWALVDVAGPSDCWNWRGTAHRKDYGKFNVGGKKYLAHRLSLCAATGKCMSTPFQALHSCDNPSCVNPNHLRWGTEKENAIDRKKRDRGHRWNGRRRGTNNPMAKINYQIARQIREMIASGVRRDEAAAKFGISGSAVSNIVNQRTWIEELGHAE